VKAVWDPAKATANLRKHGVRFADAEGALFDPEAITLEDVSPEERRFVTIGVDTIGRIVVVVYAFGATTCVSSPPGSPHEGKDNNMKKGYDFSKGRRGAVIRQRRKTRITIHLDDDVLETFRERADTEGRGYQTMINEALREHLNQSGDRVNEETIRRIVREELRKTG
jgi:uncharacterized DUF497 family protein/uncharacterized protein (DUF4415 family)